MFLGTTTLANKGKGVDLKLTVVPHRLVLLVIDCCSGHENGGAFKPAGAGSAWSR
jgi:hypothetical protein